MSDEILLLQGVGKGTQYWKVFDKNNCPNALRLKLKLQQRFIVKFVSLNIIGVIL